MSSSRSTKSPSSVTSSPSSSSSSSSSSILPWLSALTMAMWITPWDGCTWWPGSTLVFSSPVLSLSSLTRERNLLREKRWLTKRRENKLLLKHRISTDLRVSRNTGKSEEEEKEVEDRGGGVGGDCCMMEGEESGVEGKEGKKKIRKEQKINPEKKSEKGRELHPTKTLGIF